MVLGHCPKCGRGRLFAGYLKISEACDSCKLDFSVHDVGDGPVVPVMLVIGPIIVGLSFWLEFSIHPPILLHLIVWSPLIVVFWLVLLRPFKAVFIGPQFKLRSINGEFPDNDDSQKQT